MHTLVLNCGSSSLKYQLIDAASRTTVHAGQFEELADTTAFDKAIAGAIAACTEHNIDAVGHRVVHGGDTFRNATFIDEEVIEGIDAWAPLAPLHNPNNLAGIRAAMLALPDVPHIAVFDTAFHATLPRRASTYAIDTELAAKHRIRRYGFHGTSHQYVAIEAAKFLGRPLEELRIVSLHLGNGASACAIEFGHSTETSMGMTPLEGLVMGTRSGDIDAGVVMVLLREEVGNVDALDELLNSKSGLLGLSGISNNLRDLEAQAEQGNDRARLAIAVFAHQAKNTSVPMPLPWAVLMPLCLPAASVKTALPCAAESSSVSIFSAYQLARTTTMTQRYHMTIQSPISAVRRRGSRRWSLKQMKS